MQLEDLEFIIKTNLKRKGLLKKNATQGITFRKQANKILKD